MTLCMMMYSRNKPDVTSWVRLDCLEAPEKHLENHRVLNGEEVRLFSSSKSLDSSGKDVWNTTLERGELY